MISKLAYGIAETLCNSSVIEEEAKELYAYGFFILLSRIFYLIVTIIFGSILGISGESILFYGMFTLLRSYAGGIHAKTETSCTLLTTAAFLLSTITIKHLVSNNNIIVPTVMLIIGSISVFMLSPLDTEEKPLSIQERRCYKHITCIITGAYLTCALVSYALELHGIFVSITVSVILEGILLIAAKIRCLCIS